MNDDAPRYTSLGDYLSLVRKRWGLIVVPAVIAAAVAWFVSERATPTYNATASVAIQDETRLLEFLGVSVFAGNAPGTNPVIVAQTADTPALAEAVRQQLHTPLPASALRSAVSLSVNSTSGLVEVTAGANTGPLAAQIANAFAKQIAVTTTATAKQQLATATTTLRQRLGRLNPTSATAAPERANVEADISRLEFLQANATPGDVASIADVPGSPSSPKKLRNTGLGLLAGALLGLILAFVTESLDPRLRGSAAVRSELRYPVVGEVRARALGRAIQPSSVTDREAAGDVETFRIMRRKVDLLGGEGVHRAIVVTSALPEEGKSTVASSLALAAAVTGRRTLLIEADLRRPSLAGMLGIAPAPGLTEFLLGEAGPQDVLQTIPVESPGRAPNGSGPPEHSDEARNVLVCIPAGGPSSRSAELLGSARMQTLLRDVRQVYDLVVVDTPPLLPVADTLELLPLVDGVILCVRSGHTTRQQAHAVKEALAQFPDEATGLVVTGLLRRDEPGGGLYAYSYSEGERVRAAGP
jgi:polysaccharide biosynthesis transport protein